MRALTAIVLFALMTLRIESVSLRDYFSVKNLKVGQNFSLKNENKKGKMKTIFRNQRMLFLHEDKYYFDNGKKLVQAEKLMKFEKPNEKICTLVCGIVNCNKVFIDRIEKKDQLELIFYRISEAKELELKDYNNTKLKFTVGFLIFDGEKQAHFEFPVRSDIDLETGTFHLDYVDIIFEKDKVFLIVTLNYFELNEMLLFKIDFKLKNSTLIEKVELGGL